MTGYAEYGKVVFLFRSNNLEFQLSAQHDWRSELAGGVDFVCSPDPAGPAWAHMV